MSQSGNHVTALLFQVEAGVRVGLTNPSCTTKPCEWLPNRKIVKPVKIKGTKFKRDDFSKQRGKT